jgi:hypothetical protein
LFLISIVSIINKTSLELIEIYTTLITYVLDMGIISPIMFICMYNISKENHFGYFLLGIILNMLIFVGIMVINQTIFQSLAGIEWPTVAIITKVGIFVLFAIVAIYYDIKFFRNIQFSLYVRKIYVYKKLCEMAAKLIGDPSSR